MNKSKLIVLTIFAAVLIGFFALGGQEYLDREKIEQSINTLSSYYQDHVLSTAILFFLGYVLATGLSIPAAWVLTMIAGGIFGFAFGLLIASFASTIGSSIAFLVSRFILHDSIQNRFGDKLIAINQGMEKDGAFYLFAMRLVPLIPFFMINIVMGLTKIRLWTFYWVSQLGMLAGTAVYIYAGSQLANNIKQGQVLTPGIFFAFILLGIFPLLAKKILKTIKERKVLKPYPKPRRFDRNLIVIGGGAAGLVSAYIAAAVKAKVTLIEKNKMGGDCLNTGCVPSKALIRSAKFLAQQKRASEFGIKSASADFDFADVMQRVQRVIKSIEPHDSVERYTQLGVECMQGQAKILSPYQVEVNGRTLTTRNIIVAAGARPFVPDLPGLEQVKYFTSDTIWDLRELPKRLLVLGGGPIGCELAQCFTRFGSQVSLIHRGQRIMPKEDPQISQMVMDRFINEGMDLKLNHQAKSFTVDNGENIMICEHDGKQQRIPFDGLLIALGRQANTQGYGLEELGVNLADNGTIAVNEILQTNIPTIFACGDITGPYQFTHAAAHQAWFAAVNAMFGKFKRFKVDYSVIPWATFTEPEVARVGLNESQAKEKGIAYELTSYGIDDLDRAIADGEAHGVIKVLTKPGQDKILGVTIVGEHAGELITEYISAMRHGLGLNKILSTIHIYPTYAEANKYAAGKWKQAHKPEGILRWVEKFHTWRRGGRDPANRSALIDKANSSKIG